MSESEKRELLMDFLRTCAGEHLGLTAEKFNDRGRIIDDSRFPDKMVFDVERHRAIAGGSYTPGLPMASYETYRAKYVFDPARKVIDELRDEEVLIERSIDHSGVVSEFLDNFPISVVRLPGRRRRFRVEAPGWFEPFEVITFAEAEQKIREEARRLNFRDELEVLEGEPGINVDELEKQRIEAAVEIAVGKLRRAWDDPIPAE